MDNSQSFTEYLTSQYSHVVGDLNDDNFSYEKIIESVVGYYEDIINCMPGNVYWLDRNGKAVGCNQNVLEMFGFNNISQFKGLTFEDMQQAGSWTDQATLAFKQDTLAVVNTGKPKLNIEEPPIPHSDGRTIYFLTSRVPLFNRSKEVIGVVGISIDISELKHTQAELKKAKEEAEFASKNKSEFVANMSHDIKTPLASIIGIAELLTRRLNDQELEFANAMLLSSRNLLRFFDNCLEVFKFESSDIELPNEVFDLIPVVNELNEIFEPLLNKKSLTLRVKNNASPSLIVHTSQIAVYRILLNLIGNAVKFTDQGLITLNIDAKKIDADTYLELSVEDTGMGIPKDKQQYIFERFTRLVPSYKGTYDGTGIGLYIVQKLVNCMNGKIELKSQKGKGSCFTVTLPTTIISKSNYKKVTKNKTLNIQIEKTSRPRTKELLTPPKPVINGRAHVLVVEDNEIVQRIQQSLLNEMNYSVELVNSGEEALQAFEPDKYDIILMDIGLPGLQGDITSSLIRKMEKANSSKYTPIIALTAHSSKSMIVQLKKFGINDVINKPLSQDQVDNMMNKYL